MPWIGQQDGSHRNAPEGLERCGWRWSIQRPFSGRMFISTSIYTQTTAEGRERETYRIHTKFVQRVQLDPLHHERYRNSQLRWTQPLVRRRPVNQNASKVRLVPVCNTKYLDYAPSFRTAVVEACLEGQLFRGFPA